MRRIFMFTHEPCYGNTGGGEGGVFRLYLANRKYNLIEDVYFVFQDRVIHGQEMCGDLIPRPYPQNRRFPRLRKFLKKTLPTVMAIRKIRKIRQSRELDMLAYLDELNQRYHFNERDIFIFHDTHYAHAFTMHYHFPNFVLVYHRQGSLYNESVTRDGMSSWLLHRYLNRVFTETVQAVKYLGFPARGAEESLLASEPALTAVVESRERKYLYSGVDCPDAEDLPPFPDWLQELDNLNLPLFATVAELNAAKAVERIPAYLGALKRKGYAFRWILVGRGIQASLVRKEIQRNGLEENTVWIEEYVSHDLILQILSVTDFYILFHRYSIFDLSTLEAMHYGNIPILTPVGGNREVIQEGNGLFVSDFSDTDPLERLLKEDLEPWKVRNREIQGTQFNDRAFLARYADLVRSFDD